MITKDIEGVIMFDDNGILQGNYLSWHVKTFMQKEEITLVKEEVSPDKKKIEFLCNKKFSNTNQKFTICIEYTTKEVLLSLSYPAGIIYMYSLQGKFKKKFTSIGFSVKEYYLPM